ncbi:zinc-binding alcohol dehydrogenase family protein [Streptomyces sp. NPDC087212]|uniref:quinone oxidoreductase family protein n=1 Tax=Streptomyces sp. NPDC087212 TaxID=3365766 RepID=UPI0038169F14
MYAAVVHSFDAPPRYGTFETPAPRGAHEILVDVLAAGLHPRVRSGASGSHYSFDGALPMVPGVDAVGRTAEGELLYFVALDDTVGTLAERAVVDRRRAAPLAPGTDPVAVAAAMNPGMSSWVALRRRIDFRAGADVLVLGATGNAGQLAVQIAKHLGAGRVVAAGRDPERLALLPALGADETVSLLGEGDEVAQRVARSAADVDVVLDYLWGDVTERVMPALLTARADRSRALDWIEIGSMAGQDLTLPSALLRKAGLRVLGSGQGSVATADIVAELPALAELISAGVLSVHPVPMPLAEVERAWDVVVGPGERVVLVP